MSMVSGLATSKKILAAAGISDIRVRDLTSDPEMLSVVKLMQLKLKVDLRRESKLEHQTFDGNRGFNTVVSVCVVDFLSVDKNTKSNTHSAKIKAICVAGKKII